MNFADALKFEGTYTTTENGAKALKTTGDARLDFFSTVGALRNADEARVTRLFAEAYRMDPLFATKIVFYARDIRGGLGERKVFRTLIRYMAFHHPETLLNNIDLIGVYGRYDDLYSLIGTPLEDEMWKAMKKQFEEDKANLKEGNAISLLAKWIKTADASSANTRKLGILTAKKLGYSVYEFKRIVRAMRQQIDIVERHMSANEWDKITYSAVPSRAMMIYRNSFKKHDEDRFDEYLNKVHNGEEKINSSTLYPYDIVEKYLADRHWFDANAYDTTLEAQWKALPNYVEPGTNALVIADTSGSMEGRPLNSAIGLAIYFAERNGGPYHNLFMSFSGESTIQTLVGETLWQKISSVNNANWGMNTNLEKAFTHVLQIAINNNVPKKEMPKALIVISDMEIDSCAGTWTFYDYMEKLYSSCGYDIPNVIFWNVDSRHDVFHADATRRGVQLVSGQSASTFKNVLSFIDSTPIEAMENVINSERYSAITISI